MDGTQLIRAVATARMEHGRRTTPVLAAGAVVWRCDTAGRVLVALVHRPKYDDWSLPKGKCDPGEHPVGTALREVREETGLEVSLGRRLPSQVYPVRGPDGTVAKAVHWWLAEAVGPPGPRTSAVGPVPEIDEVRWLPLGEARAALTHDRDRVVLDAVDLAPLRTTTVLLARHASAGSRSSWSGEDRFRPLDADGQQQAVWLADLAEAFRPGRVVSAEPVRCTQTVTPYAERHALAVDLDERLSERSHSREPFVALRTFADVTTKDGPALVCSQGGVIPDVVAAMHREGGLPQPRPSCPKGSVWILSFHRGRLVASDFHATTDPGVDALPPGALASGIDVDLAEDTAG